MQTTQRDHLALDHVPLLPPRKSVVGEGVFLEAWQQLMANTLDEDGDEPKACLLHTILAHLPDPVAQRHATVAASFVTWLGTNGGRGLLDKADRMRVKAGTPVAAFCFAWASVNRRDPCVGRGLRAIEAILGPIELVTETNNHAIFKWLPKLSVADYETVEAIVEWLPSAVGMAFLTKCQTTIKTREAQQRQADREAFARIQACAG